MSLVFALITDLHFGPEARFAGKLRKLSHRAAALTDEAVAAIARESPAFLVNLGDDVEDEAYRADLDRYEECHRALARAACPIVNVAGNHDTVYLGEADLNRVWGRRGHLYYAFDAADWHFVVLHTVERKDVDVSIDRAQLAWLEADLASAAPRPVVVLMHHSASEQDLDDSRWFSAAPHLALVRERAELRALLERAGNVRAVFNGHLHRNHFDAIQGIAYVTVQSLVENLDDDAPGRPAAAWALVRLDRARMVVRVRGNDPARYQVEWG